MSGGRETTIATAIDADEVRGIADRIEAVDESFTLETVPTETDALDASSIADVDCVLATYRQATGDGIDLLREVRAAADNVPFILISTVDDEAVASDAIAADVTGYVRWDATVDQAPDIAATIREAVDEVRHRRRHDTLIEAIETAREGIAILDESERFQYVNAAYATLYGYEPDEMVGKHWELIYRDSDIEYVEEEVMAELAETQQWQGETTGLRADGTTFPEDHTIAVTQTDHYVCTVRDATSEKRRQQELERRNEQFRYVEQTAQVGYWEIDLETPEPHDVTLSEGVYAIHDLPPDADFDVEQGLQYYHPDDRETVETALKQAIEHGEPYDYEVRIQTAEGTEKWVRSIGEPVEEDGEVVKLRGVFGDITDRKRYERQLARANERLNKVTSMLSHDLRNPLTVAAGRLDLIEQDTDSDHVVAAQDAIQRCESLITNLREVVEGQDLVADVEAVALPSLVEASWRSVNTASGTLSIETGATIQADPQPLRQLFENLFRNAVEHSPNDVTVTVGDLEDGFYIADDGPGIPASERDDVFDSGFSTDDQGTGLGLAIVHDIVQAHDWSIDITDAADGGARFEITGVQGDS